MICDHCAHPHGWQDEGTTCRACGRGIVRAAPRLNLSAAQLDQARRDYEQRLRIKERRKK